MNIAIVFYGSHPYPFNRGIDQLTQALIKIGHKPQIVAKSSKLEGNIIESVRYPIIKVPTQKMGANLLYFHFPYNPFWLTFLIKEGKKNRWDAIIVRETPLAWPVLIAARKLNIPAYLDMRENLAAMYRRSRNNRNPLINIFRNYKLVRLYESLMLPSFDHIFTVSLELKMWLVKEFNILSSSISVLENTPSEQFMNISDRVIAETKKNNDIFRLVYAGNIGESKGIELIIESLPYILKKKSSVRLRIIGDGKYLNILKHKIVKLNLMNVVEFFPMLSLEELAKALAECHVGLETCKPGEQTNQTVPGKLFEYMALGLPVLSSSRKSVIRILSDTNAGWVYHSSNPEELAKYILKIIDDKETLELKSKNARLAIINRYNWKSQVKVLSNIFPPIFNL